MGLFSGLGSFFGPIGGLVGGVADDLIGRDDARQTNQTAYAQQRELRQTAYQDTTADLKAAGLNPMLAFSNGATAAASGPPVLNKGLQAAQQNSAQASIQNVEADTDLKRAQADQARASVEQTITSTGKLAAETTYTKQNTAYLIQDMSRLLSQQKLADNQAVESSARAALADAQRELANMQKNVAAGTISLNEAQKIYQQALTTYQKLQTKLREYDEPKAINEANYNLSEMGEYEPYARGLSTYGDAVWNSVGGWRKIFGKKAPVTIINKGN